MSSSNADPHDYFTQLTTELASLDEIPPKLHPFSVSSAFPETITGCKALLLLHYNRLLAYRGCAVLTRERELMKAMRNGSVTSRDEIQQWVESYHTREIDSQSMEQPEVDEITQASARKMDRNINWEVPKTLRKIDNALAHLRYLLDAAIKLEGPRKGLAKSK